MRVRRHLSPVAAALLVVAAVLGTVAAAPPGDGPQPAPFVVGAAVRSLAPPMPVFIGGADVGPPTTRAHDPLQVRAIYISNGTHATAFAVVDSQAYFAAYQEGPLGIADVREQAARAVAATTGTPMAASDLIVQGSHSHAAPTLEGIWGPVPTAYLQLVHDRTIEALTAAARHAVPARLQWGTAATEQLAAVDVPQNSYPGWSQPGVLSVLRAVRPADDGTVATFVNVPFHPATTLGASVDALSADIYGVVRHQLDKALGGVTIVGPATLGRMQAPVENGKTPASWRNTDWFGTALSDLAFGALGGARWVTDATIASAERFMEIPADNAALLALNDAYRLPPDQRQRLFEATGLYPADRSLDPPYRIGNALGVPLTVVRIGGLAYVSQPGEPFPEIRQALVDATSGADLLVDLSKGQDDVGYYFPTWSEPFAFGYPTDTGLFSIAPQAGDQIAQGQLANLQAVGFTTEPLAVTRPLGMRLTQIARPGLMAIAAPATGAADADGGFTTTLQAIHAPAVIDGADLDGPVRWDFGDGTTATTPAMIREPGDPAILGGGGTSDPALFTHRFAPGTYTVRVTATDTDGHELTASTVVRVHPRVIPGVTTHPLVGGRLRYTATVRGGDGPVLAWRWRFDDGVITHGKSVTRSAAATRSGTLTVTDASGAEATVRFGPGR